MKWKLVFVSLTISLHALSASAKMFPPFCSPEESWKTVDRVSSEKGSAFLAGIASYRNYAYAVGSAQLPITPAPLGSWVIRRSTDFGETWSTARVLIGGGRGVAVDPRNGHIYTIGLRYFEDTDITHGWIVQKSTDNGLTWRIVDNFIDPIDEREMYLSGKITVDGKGNVIIVGDDHHESPIKPIMRRSEDGGTTWTTIKYADVPFHASAIAASDDGQVVVAGGYPTPNPDTTPSKWVVKYSSNGKSDWKLVDEFNGSSTDPIVGAFASGVSISKSGRVAVTGSVGKGFEGPFRLVVRHSYLSDINRWTTLLNYRPRVRLRLGSASSAHIAWKGNQRFFINGRQRLPGTVIDTNIALDKRLPLPVRVSDRIKNPFTSPFQHEYVFTGGLTVLSNGTVLSGYIQDDENDKSWFIRKMTCPLK
jgi:hypothetical protein